MPPSPKAPGERLRRNHGQREWVTVGPRTTPPPPLPNGLARRKAPREWWARVWSSEIAGAYLDVDVLALARGAMIVDLIARGEANASMIAQLTWIEDRYGLTPGSRQRLMWMVDRPGDDQEQAVAPVIDIRDRLRKA